MRRSWRSNVALALSLALLLPTAAACYRYVPPDGGPASLARGERMRVSLSRPVSVDLGEISVDDAVLVSGELVELKEDGSIVMSVTEAQSPSGATRGGVGESVTIPADAIASVEKRVINAATTALVVVIIAGAATAIGVAALNSGSANGGENGNGPPVPEEDERPVLIP
ncbi:MAG: hypothetical protein P8Y10_08770 [Gemmatimonadales bacterium]|jgi:hypothetical protein